MAAMVITSAFVTGSFKMHTGGRSGGLGGLEPPPLFFLVGGGGGLSPPTFIEQ